jgi:hypothetical protein
MQTNCNIVSGEMLQQLCDVYIGKLDYFANNPVISVQKEKCLNIDIIPDTYDNPPIIFLYSILANEFFTKHVHKLKNKFILVSHNTDQNINEECKKYADHPLLVHWFSQNLNFRHPKASILPIGVANTQWDHGKRELFQNLPKIEFMKKENLVYFEFTVETNYAKRAPCRGILSKYFQFGNRLSSPEYLNKIANSKFVISPQGNGIDSHRIWETLLVGSVPVVSRCVFTEELEKDFPILIVDDWEQVTPEFLENNISKFSSIEWPINKLDFKYYKDRIDSYKIPMMQINCNIVSGEMLEQLCDIYIGNEEDFAYNPVIQSQKDKCLHMYSIPENYNNPSKVYVYTNCVKDFFINHIHKFNNRFVLVSHNSDWNVDETYREIAEHPMIVHWFTQNLNIRHPKISMIPIGVANTRWNHGKRELFQNLPKIEFTKKENLVYFEFTVGTNYTKRENCRSILSKNFQFGNRLSSPEYLNKIANSKFVISPEGNGIDCHRIWESLLVGSVPVVSRSIFTEELEKDFPMLIVDDWEQVTAEFLQNNIYKFASRVWPIEKLDFEYYKNIIEEKSEIAKNKINIVYSFVGKLPEYIVDTVWQSRLFYNDDIWLITDDIESPYITQINLMKLNVKLVDYKDLVDDNNKNMETKYNSIFHYIDSLKGREKLIMRSFERFFLVKNLMLLKNIKNILFIELDNTIYDNPYKWLSSLEKKNISAMGHNDNSIKKHEFNCDVMSTGICYIRDYESATHYCNYLITYFETMLVNKDVFPCEMNATFRYYKKYPDNVETLPLIWKVDGLPEYYYNKLDTYRSIFDGASLGVQLFGMDPFHSNGTIIYGERTKWTNMDFRSYKFKWDKDSEGRNIPYIQNPNNSEWLRINNLHIHSKVLTPALSKPY